MFSSTHIIIALLVLIVIELGYLVYITNKRESFKMVCDDCAKLINNKNDCSMINNPMYSNGPCDGAGEFLGQSQSWIQLCANQQVPCIDKPDDVKPSEKTDSA